MSASYKVVLELVSPGADDYGACSECPDLLATYILGKNEGDCRISGTWPFTLCGALYGIDTLYVYLRFGAESGLPVAVITIDVLAGFDLKGTWTYKHYLASGEKFDCLNLSDLVLDYVSSPGDKVFCDMSSTQILLTSL